LYNKADFDETLDSSGAVVPIRAQPECGPRVAGSLSVANSLVGVRFTPAPLDTANLLFVYDVFSC